MAALGVLISGWILFYTDWFPVVGGLLGLSGLFAWAAFLSGLLTEDRKKELQVGFERLVLGSRATWRAIACVGLACLFCGSCFGTVILDTSGDDQGRLMAVARAGLDGPSNGAAEYLVPHGEQKVVVFSGWLGRRYTVKASGLPSVFATIYPLRRTRLRLPTDFWIRPVVLIRLSPTLSADAAQGLFTLTVKNGNRIIGVLGRDQYHGETVWVGCDVDVAVPEKLSSRWKVELARLPPGLPALPAGREEELLSRWMAPVALAEGVPPRVGDILGVALTAGGREIASQRAQVRSSRARALDVQEVYLTYPSAPDSGSGDDTGGGDG